MKIAGHDITAADVGADVIFQPPTDPTRPPAHGKLHSWDGTYCYVQFYCAVTGAYREIPFAVNPSGLTWAKPREEAVADDAPLTSTEITLLDDARAMGSLNVNRQNDCADRLIRMGLLTSTPLTATIHVCRITSAGLDALASARMRGDLR